MARKEVSSYDITPDYSMSVFRGDTLTFDINITGIEDATVGSLYFSVKADIDDDDYIIQKSIGDGITDISEGDDIAYRIRVAPAEMTLIEPGTYVYDLQLGLGSDIYTICSGTLIVKEDVTR